MWVSTLTDARIALKSSFFWRAPAKIGSDGRVMTNAINDEVILAARLFLATLFLIFGWICWSGACLIASSRDRSHCICLCKASIFSPNRTDFAFAVVPSWRSAVSIAAM